MKLSLSVRVAEAPGSKEEAIRSFDEIAALADQLGYNAVCMRASQAGIQTPLQQITAIRQKTRQLNLAVSMVTGYFRFQSTTTKVPMPYGTSRLIWI